MTPLLAQPIDHLLSRLSASRSRQLIGMAGLPGSGKSTLAAQLTAAVNARTAPDTMIALGMDGFHLTKAELRRLPDPDEAMARRGAPWTFNTSAFYQRLQQLRGAANQESITWPDFQHDIGDPVEDATTIPASTRLIIVEGLYLLHHADGWEEISQFFDERWYLDTPFEAAMERLVLRHMRAWSMTRSEAEQRIATNDRLNAAIVVQSFQYAHWRLISSA